MPERKIIIGLEVHAQLHTNTKLFCGCPTRVAVKGVEEGFSPADSGQPNTLVCPTCLGFPGSKPVLNKKALDYALKVALALNCEINRDFFFSRKTYFYPDLAKNFQITQYEVPVGIKGFVELDSGKKIGITRVHIEEDPASLVHGKGISGSSYCLVDYNRSGIPLVEIVTDPDMGSPAEGREFLNKLLNILGFLGVFIAGEDILKCDSNISFEGSERVEIKNVNGFKNVEAALSCEAERQIKILSGGGRVGRETRGFDEESHSTYFMRSKEQEEDYGYIFEPDLSGIEVSEEWLNRLKKEMPELPEEKAKRLVKEFNLTPYDAKVICSDHDLSQLYEDLSEKVSPILAAKFVSREVLSVLNRNGLSLRESCMKGNHLADLLRLLGDGKVSEKNAREAVIKYALEKISPKEFLEKNSLLLDLDSSAVTIAIDDVLKANPQSIVDYKVNPEKVLNFLTGMVMRSTKGKAAPKEVQELLKERLAN